MKGPEGCSRNMVEKRLRGKHCDYIGVEVEVAAIVTTTEQRSARSFDETDIVKAPENGEVRYSGKLPAPVYQSGGRANGSRPSQSAECQNRKDRPLHGSIPPRQSLTCARLSDSS